MVKVVRKYGTMTIIFIIIVLAVALAVLESTPQSNSPITEDSVKNLKSEEDVDNHRQILNSNTSEHSKLESLSVIALDSSGSRAVVKMTDGKMKVFTVGDTVPGTSAIVLQVLHDKLVLQDTVVNDAEQPEKQIVWLYKSKTASDKSILKRFTPNEPGNNQHLQPTVQDLKG